MIQIDQFLTVATVSKLEGISEDGIIKRIRRGKYPQQLVQKVAREVGGYEYKIHASLVKSELLENVEVDVEVKEKVKRKVRCDAGTTIVDDALLFRCAAIVTSAKTSTYFKLKKNFGYKEAYKKYQVICEAEGKETVTYRRFIDLVKPLVDTDVQKKINLGTVKYRNTQEMVLRHDYSSYEPMQMIQNDHSQYDCVCVHNGRLIRPWASEHISAGDRIRHYPTITERPDSYSLADNLGNFILKYGLSQQPVIYKSDNGKQQRSRLMSKNEVKEIVLPPFNIEEHHLKVMKLMHVGLTHEKGMMQNLGMVESHSTVRLARAKMIERQFGIGGNMEWFKDRPEYTGRKYEERPEELAKEIKRGNIWQSEEMVDYVINKIDNFNNRTHQGIKDECKGIYAVPHTYNLDIDYFQNSMPFLKATEGLIPQTMSEVYRIFNDPLFAKDSLRTEIYSPMWRRQIFELCGWQSRAIPSRDTLSMLAMGNEERTVHPYGISINNKEYINYKLKTFIGKKVIVRWFAEDLIRITEESGKKKLFIRELYVFDARNEEFICVAEPHPRTVTGIVPQGYAKSFISIRKRNEAEITSAAKITTAFAEGKEQEVERKTNVIILSTARDLAARNLANAKKEKALVKEQQTDNELLTKMQIESLYGKTVEGTND